MNDILNRLYVQCGSDLHSDFVRSLFSEAAGEIERLRRDAEQDGRLQDEAHSDSESGISTSAEKMTARYTVCRNRCQCHPETCCCNDWAVCTSDGVTHATYYKKETADEVAAALNLALAAREATP